MRAEVCGVQGSKVSHVTDFIIHLSLPWALWTVLEAVQLFPFPNIVF